MTDWKEIIMQNREAELGVTPLGIKHLHSCATQYGYIANERGVIDPETDKVVTDPTKLAPIIQRGKMLMRATSPLGKELLEML